MTSLIIFLVHPSSATICSFVIVVRGGCLYPLVSIHTAQEGEDAHAQVWTESWCPSIYSVCNI